MKKFSVALIVLGMLAVSGTAVYAADVNVVINNEPVASDVPAQITAESRTVVPLRVISEKLGAEVDWDPETKTVFITGADSSICLSVGNKDVKMNDDIITLDSPAQIIEGRTMVPLRAVAEFFGCQVDWDAETKTVYIKSGQNTEVKTEAADDFAKQYPLGNVIKQNDIASRMEKYGLVTASSESVSDDTITNENGYIEQRDGRLYLGYASNYDGIRKYLKSDILTDGKEMTGGYIEYFDVLSDFRSVTVYKKSDYREAVLGQWRDLFATDLGKENAVLEKAADGSYVYNTSTVDRDSYGTKITTKASYNVDKDGTLTGCESEYNFSDGSSTIKRSLNLANNKDSDKDKTDISKLTATEGNDMCSITAYIDGEKIGLSVKKGVYIYFANNEDDLFTAVYADEKMTKHLSVVDTNADSLTVYVTFKSASELAKELKCDAIARAFENDVIKNSDEKPADYVIKNVRVVEGVEKKELIDNLGYTEDDILAEITYDIKPVDINKTFWIAGNGEVKEDWVVDKDSVVCLRAENDEEYHVISSGTGW